MRTVADPDAVTIRRIVGGRRVTWPEISSLRLGQRSRIRGRAGVSAVLTDGAELSLPAVGVRDLPQLAAVSGGRLPDPAGERRAGSAFPRHHPRPQRRRSPRPLARHRHDRRRLRQADRRDRQLLHAVRARSRAPQGHRRARRRRRSARRAGCRGSSTRSPWTTASRWATAGCSTRCPRREVIADAVEYMVNGHAADALVCISNCDKITPGHAQRRDAAQHPHGVRLRRADGGRQGGRRRRRRPRPDRPDHRDLRLRLAAGRRRRARRSSSAPPARPAARARACSPPTR